MSFCQTSISNYTSYKIFNFKFFSLPDDTLCRKLLAVKTQDKLTQYLQRKTEIKDCYRGNVKTQTVESKLLIDGEEGEEAMGDVDLDGEEEE